MKSYATVHGQPSENDKGYVSISYEKHVTELQREAFKNCAHFYRLIILCSFICLNIAAPIVLAKSASLYYPRIMDKSSTGDIMECLYWATAILAFPLNNCYTVSSIRHQILHDIPTITLCIVPFVNHVIDKPQ